MGPYAGVDFNPCRLQSRLQQIYHGQPYARVDLNPMPVDLNPMPELNLSSEDCSPLCNGHQPESWDHRFKRPIVRMKIVKCKRKLLPRVQWFWLFFTIWGITTHPRHPKGPRIWKLAKKNFQLHPWPAEIFGKNRKMCFFGMISKFNFWSPVWQIFTIFSACFIYGSLSTRTKF